MRVGFLQYDVSHNIDENFRYLETNLSKQNCELLLLPELSLCGYLFQNREALRVYAEAVPAGAATQRMLALSKAYDCTIIFGLAEKENESIYNTAVIASKGRYIGKYRHHRTIVSAAFAQSFAPSIQYSRPFITFV